jgi:hypothetical protein
MLRPTQPPSHWVPGVKQPGCEAGYSPATNAEVNNDGVTHPLPHTPSWHNAQLVKHRDNFTFHQGTI